MFEITNKMFGFQCLVLLVRNKLTFFENKSKFFRTQNVNKLL